MNEELNEEVSVILIFDCNRKSVYPAKLRWRNREYRINKLAYHHQYRQGRTLIHVFFVGNENLDFHLELNSENLHWTLKEVLDATSL